MGVEGRSARPLDAMVRPQFLLAIGHGDRFERVLARMAGGEARMMRRMPVLRQDDMRGRLHQIVHKRHDLVAALDC
jgi:hypothetical protein